MYGNGMPTTTVIVDLATAGSARRQAGFSNTGSQSRVSAQLAAAPYANLNPAAATGTGTSPDRKFRRFAHRHRGRLGPGLSDSQRIAGSCRSSFPSIPLFGLYRSVGFRDKDSVLEMNGGRLRLPELSSDTSPIESSGRHASMVNDTR